MKPEGSLPHSQEPATCPYPKTTQNSSLQSVNQFQIFLNNKGGDTIKLLLLYFKNYLLYHSAVLQAGSRNGKAQQISAGNDTTTGHHLTDLFLFISRSYNRHGNTELTITASSVENLSTCTVTRLQISKT
jgi:hypothetical protein